MTDSIRLVRGVNVRLAACSQVCQGRKTLQCIFSLWVRGAIEEHVTPSQYHPEFRELLRELRTIEHEHRALRAEMRNIERRETRLYRQMERLLRVARPTYVMLVEHRPGKKDRITRHALDSVRALTALAKGKGSSGLFCGCRLILNAPQRDGWLDICILIRCSNEPERTGFPCEYWCFTLIPPVVAVASKQASP
jgi:hypothetical protein